MSSGAAILDVPNAELSRKRTGAYISIRGSISLLLIAAAHLPILGKYCLSLYALPQYEYILALPVFAAILIHSRAWYLGPLTPGGIWSSVGLFLFSAGLVAVAAVLDSPWLGAISALWALLAVAHAWGGARFTKAFLPAWCVLWLLVRLPMDSDTRLVQNLQSIAAARASVLLHLMGQPHILQGNVVETPERVYAVEEACSGVQSLFAITACTVFFVLWSRMSWWRSLLLLAVGWWWVWAANVARVVIVTYFNTNYDLPIDTGWMHDALGVALFGLTLGLIYSSGRFLWFILPFGIFGRRDGIDTEALAPSAVDKVLTPTQFPSLSATPLAAAWLSLFYLIIVCFLLLPQLRVPEATAAPTQLDLLQANAVPQQVGPWTLVPESYEREERKRDSQWGARSQSWRYRKGNRELIVSVDYPFMGWHDLGTCYAGSGWSLNLREHKPLSDDAASADPAAKNAAVGEGVVLYVQKPVERDFGLVLFQIFNGRMEPIPIPQANVFKAVAERFQTYRQRLSTLGASGSDLNSQTQSFQLQIFIKDHAPFTQQDERELRQLYARFRSQLAATLSPDAKQGESR